MGEKRSRKKSPHDLILNTLLQFFPEEKYEVMREFIYNNYDGRHEADIIAIPKESSHAYVIEIKGRNTKRKRRYAFRQIKHDLAYLNEERREIKTFTLIYVHGNKPNQELYTALLLDENGNNRKQTKNLQSLLTT